MSLHPGGAGNARWAASQKVAPPFDATLLAVADALELDRALALRAQELAALVPGADAPTRSDLALLVLALLVACERGSTRLGVRGPAAVELSALLDEMQRGGLGAERALRVSACAESVLSAGDGADARSPFHPVVVGARDRGPLVASGDYLYPQRLFVTEGRIAQAVAARMSVGAAAEAAAAQRAREAAACERALRDVLAAPAYAGGRPLRLSREQVGAVKAAATERLALVSGGPGTGKTSIVVSLLRVLARLGYDAEADVALAAPTGKAADRMRASVAQALRALQAPTFDDVALLREPPRSQTLHRLLGFSPRTGRYRAQERNPLGVRLVIVDEASMIDVVMMDRLLRALGPDTRLVLLGDADQLPSVDAGAVFRDLCALRAGGVVRLTHSYRMDAEDPAGRTILEVARAVHRGKVLPLLGAAPDALEPGAPGEEARSTSEAAPPAIVAHTHARALLFRGCEWIDAPDGPTRAALLARWDERFVRPMEQAARALGSELTIVGGRPEDALREPLRALFERLESARLLAVTRAGALGVERVNQHFHGLRTRDRRARFVVGEPVMVHQNDYVRGLFNGDTGVVLSGLFEFERAARRVVVFRRDDGFVAFPLAGIEHSVELAYAITVHKAQGSEFDAVGVLLPDVDTPLLSREILYTAITRARHSVTLVGARWAIEAATSRPVTRSSGLVARVTDGLGSA
ncbi:MAG: exodeoxyribonuclease V subunit alpha [Sandaracinaceae bacterium]|nr:exodeoxyribonuclease V subunit alpha [Sandaracinaceae bacterium]